MRAALKVVVIVKERILGAGAEDRATEIGSKRSSTCLARDDWGWDENFMRWDF